MRAAIFTDVFPRLSNTFIINQITGLIDRGVDVDIFARAKGDFVEAHRQVGEYRLEERLVHLPVPEALPGRALDAAQRLLRAGRWRGAALAVTNPLRHGRDGLSLVNLYTALALLPRPRYGVVHAQFAKLGPVLLPLLRARGEGEPLIVSVRGADLTRRLKREPRLYDELFREASLFLPVSESLARMLRDAGCPADRIEVHHSGVELAKFPFVTRTRRPDEPTRLLFIGRLTEKKGLRYGLEALALARRKGHDVKLTVIGEGELTGDLRQLAQELGVGEAVRWRGRLDQSGVAAELEQAHLLMAPSVTAADGDQEGIPNVLKEAMACGLPVLATRHSGIPELVEEGVSGLLVPERDAASLAEGLMWLADHPERWPEFGAAGRKRVERDYDSDRLNDRLEEIYRGLANARRS